MRTDDSGFRLGMVPAAPKRGALRPVALDDVVIDGGFWGERQVRNRERTLPHIDHWLQRMGWLDAFTTTGRAVGARGAEFTDSEVYKYIEALTWESARRPGGASAARAAELSRMVAAVQAPDGYVGTAFGGAGQDPRYSDLAFGHELYCAGHLIQAAVARGRVCGLDDVLVGVAVRLADHICDVFGADGVAGFCGHPIIEMALVELGRLLDEQRYVDQAALFVERRGRRTLPRTDRGWSYFQDDEPVRAARVLRGHAVRALYLTSGAVDLAVETDDDGLLAAVVGQWEQTHERRTYVTGGMGSRHMDEAFGADWVLPPDRAYSETCAGIASAMLSWRLLLRTGEVRYADALERVLYNVLATGVGRDGESFFYANTLHQRTPTTPLAADEPQLLFGGGMRAPWYDVSCCPTNIARTVAGLGTMLFTTSDAGVQVHLFSPGTLDTTLPDGRRVRLRVETEYPHDGEVTVTVEEAPAGSWELALRVPAWAAGAELVEDDVVRPVAPGYATVSRDLRTGDRVRLQLPLVPRWVAPDPRVDAVRGCLAVERGPIVLAAEAAAEHSTLLDEIRVDPGAAPVDGRGGVQVRVRTLPGAPPGVADGLTRGSDGATWLRLIPYHAWGNSGPSTMRVWLPRTGVDDHVLASSDVPRTTPAAGQSEQASA